MRVSDIQFSGQAELPPDLYCLQHQLSGGGETAPADLLGPGALLDELRAVADGVLRHHGNPNPRAWRSLATDFSLMLDRLGPGVAAGVACAAAPVRRRLRALTPPTSDSDARDLSREVDGLRAAFVRPEVLQAAWDDLVAGYRSSAEPERTEGTSRIFRSVAELQDHEWVWLARSLAHALNGTALSLIDIGAAIELEDDSMKSLLKPAGWPSERRLDAMRAYLGRPAPRGELVVWVAFEGAHLGDLYLNLGRAEFFAGVGYPEAVVHGHWRSQGPPPECQDGFHEHYLPNPDAREWVLVRLVLGDGPIAGAGERGRRLAEVLVQIAYPGSGWRLMDGAAIVRENKWFGSPVYPSVDPRRMHDEAARLESTGHGLARLDAAFVGRVAEHEPAIVDATADLRWHASTQDVAEPAQRLALTIRLLERRLPSPDSPDPEWAGWGGDARWWLRGWWVHDALVRELVDAAHAGLAGLPDRGATYPKLSNRFREKMLPWARDGGFYIRPAEILAELPRLLEYLEVGRMNWRVVASAVERTKTSEDLLVWLEELGNLFDVLIRRAARARNAVLHGNDTVPEMIASVEPFTNRLARMVIDAELRALREAMDLPSVLRQDREVVEAKIARLAAGDAPADALFG